MWRFVSRCDEDVVCECPIECFSSILFVELERRQARVTVFSTLSLPERSEAAEMHITHSAEAVPIRSSAFTPFSVFSLLSRYLHL
jgi:hypothetical protein